MSGKLRAARQRYRRQGRTCSMQAPRERDPADNPTLAAGKQKPLRGFPQESVDAILKTKPFVENLCMGTVEPDQFDLLAPFLEIMAEDIKVQQARIGGDFVVAFAIPNKKLRDLVREHIPDIIFVALEMSKENVGKRLEIRHGDTLPPGVIDGFKDLSDIYKGPEDGEKNCYGVEIKEDMTRDDVLGKILEKLK